MAMDTKVIAFFPACKRGGPQEQGHILRVEGKIIEEDFKQADNRDTDDYRLEPDDFPRTEGIWVFEGTAATASKWDQPEYTGSWRKATAEDLKGLIA
jgi:hypothetical protein